MKDLMLLELIEELRLTEPHPQKVKILMGKLNIPFHHDPVQQMLATLNYADSFCKTFAKKKHKKKEQYDSSL